MLTDPKAAIGVEYPLLADEAMQQAQYDALVEMEGDAPPATTLDALVSALMADIGLDARAEAACLRLANLALGVTPPTAEDIAARVRTASGALARLPTETTTAPLDALVSELRARTGKDGTAYKLTADAATERLRDTLPALASAPLAETIAAAVLPGLVDPTVPFKRALASRLPLVQRYSTAASNYHATGDRTALPDPDPRDEDGERVGWRVVFRPIDDWPAACAWAEENAGRRPARAQRVAEAHGLLTAQHVLTLRDPDDAQAAVRDALSKEDAALLGEFERWSVRYTAALAVRVTERLVGPPDAEPLDVVDAGTNAQREIVSIAGALFSGKARAGMPGSPYGRRRRRAPKR